MEKPYESVKIINMFLHPVFIVKDGMIVDMNNAAKAMEIQANTPISDIIPDALDEYTNYEGGYLSLNVIVNACKQLATVVRSEIGDIFHLRTADTAAEFRTMALISQQIRK